jgi:hypothetical protein
VCVFTHPGEWYWAVPEPFSVPVDQPPEKIKLLDFGEGDKARANQIEIIPADRPSV